MGDVYERGVAPSPPATRGDYHPLAWLDEVGEEGPRLVVNHGSQRHIENEVGTGAAVPEISLSVRSILGGPMGTAVVANQGGNVGSGGDDDVAAVATGASGRSAAGPALDTFESGHAGASATPFDVDTNAVDEVSHVEPSRLRICRDRQGKRPQGPALARISPRRER